eukprot:UN10128
MSTTNGQQPQQQQPPQATTKLNPNDPILNQPARQQFAREAFLDRRDTIHSSSSEEFRSLTPTEMNKKNDDWLWYLSAMGFFSLGMS